LSSEAASGATAIEVADSSNFDVNRRYTITAADGRSEWVRVVANDTDTDTLTIASELAYTYPVTTSTLLSTRLTVAVSAANAATLDEGYEARWEYTVDGVVQRVNTFFDVTLTKWSDVVIPRYQFKLIAGDLASADLESLEGEGLDFKDEIDQAIIKLKAEISSRGYRISLFRSAADFTESIVQRCLLSLAERAENVPALFQDSITDWIDLRREVYDAALTTALNNTSYDADESGDVTQVEKDARLGSMRIVL
jgi:hypothetical protein